MEAFNRFSELFSEVWQEGVFGLNASEIIIGIVIFLIFYVLRRLFARFIISRLNKLVNKTSTNIDNTVVEVIEGPLKFLPVVLGFFIATSYINLSTEVQDFIDLLNRTLITVFIFWLLHQLVIPFSFIIRNFEDKISKPLVNWTLKGLEIIIIVLGIVAVLELWGIKVGPVIAGLGLFGVECLEYFTNLRNRRANEPIKSDLLSMLAHGKDTQNMPPMEFLGNLILLIVGGNDTTRNSISGGVLALNENPGEYDKLRANPGLISNMVSEIIRWQTPLAYMRRTANRDIEFGGQHIKQGDKIAMWYLSGNRDDEVIEDPDRFWIDRPHARHHLSFGFGIHRCMGNRLAEMQLRVLWEEIMQRFRMIEVVGEIERVQSSFVRGYATMPVQVHPW